ncbi:MAG: hypothetical protein IJR51_05475 [Clostridia bacterium]|nr:hypothetical protein [Clostridia bacterium]MBQ9506587.1 hypothetical protein [Clostridia bacterium]MBR5423757.1 hypothetical protein [Clostridia bacterium]
MVKLLIGEKGSGKTKKLLDAVNTALQESKGHVVCVEKDDLLRYQVSYRVRLLAAANYGISGYDAFYGFLSGLCAGDHDITDILIDATLKIGGRDYEALATFLERIARLSDLTGTVFTFTVSTAKENLPERIEKICEIE